MTFHGFGQTGEMFEPIKSSLGKIYKIYSFDFPFHGLTKWEETKPFTKTEMIHFLEEFMMIEGYSRISLMGFSMGGRVVLSLLQDISDKLDEVFLISADGISERIYYRKALANKIGDKFFRQMLRHPNILINSTKACSKIGLTKKYVADYVSRYISSKRRREKIYQIWLSMSTFRSDLKKVGKAVKQNHLKVYLLWGKRDRILPVALAHKLKAAVPECELNLVDGGHFIVDERLNEIFLNLKK